MKKQERRLLLLGGAILASGGSHNLAEHHDGVAVKEGNARQTRMCASYVQEGNL
jgi:hypothetical protein